MQTFDIFITVMLLGYNASQALVIWNIVSEVRELINGTVERGAIPMTAVSIVIKIAGIAVSFYFLVLMIQLMNSWN